MHRRLNSVPHAATKTLPIRMADSIANRISIDIAYAGKIINTYEKIEKSRIDSQRFLKLIYSTSLVTIAAAVLSHCMI